MLFKFNVGTEPLIVFKIELDNKSEHLFSVISKIRSWTEGEKGSLFRTLSRRMRGISSWASTYTDRHPYKDSRGLGSMRWREEGEKGTKGARKEHQRIRHEGGRGQVISLAEAWGACRRGAGYPVREKVVQTKLNNIDGQRKLKAVKVFSVVVRNGGAA